MSYREDEARSGAVGYVFAGLIVLLLGGSIIALDVVGLFFALGAAPTAKPLDAGVVVFLFIVLLPGVLFLLVGPLSLVATAMLAFTLAVRSVRATDKSAPLAVVAQQASQTRLYLAYFPVTRTRWSVFWSDLGASLFVGKGWRLFLAVYVFTLALTTVALQQTFLAATVPLVVVLCLIAAGFVVWQKLATGRVLVKASKRG